MLRRICLRPSWIRSRVGIVCLVMLTLLLAASSCGAVMAFQTPMERADEKILLSYQHKGKFDYGTYIKHVDIGEKEFFYKIIESVEVIFFYKFVPDKGWSARQVASQVEVSAILEAPLWEKTFTLVDRATLSGGFSIPFQLDLASIKEQFDIIDKEIGMVTYPRQVTIEAKVRTRAETDQGRLDDTFVTSAQIELSGTTLKWRGGSNQFKRGYIDELGYAHVGRFGYRVKLAPNSLYGAATLESIAEPDPPLPLGPGSKQSAKDVNSIDSIDFTFSYGFESFGRPPRNLAEEVEVTGILENPGNWSDSIVLLPRRNKTGASFNTRFPLDLAMLYERVEAADSEYGVSGAKYDLKIRAWVHTVGETDSKPINEVFTQDFSLSLGKNTIELDKKLTQTKQGAVTNTTWVTEPGVMFGRIGTGIASAAFLFVLPALFVGYLRAAPPEPSAAEKEARQARKKYKGVVVSVRELPPAEASDTTVELNSLAELVVVADGMGRPVFHKVEEQRYIYLVMDGNAKYLYMNQDS